MIEVVDAEKAQAEAARLAGEVREHKSAASYHKRAGRRAKTSLVALQQMCDRAGIRLRVENNPRVAHKGGHDGDRSLDGPEEDTRKRGEGRAGRG